MSKPKLAVVLFLLSFVLFYITAAIFKTNTPVTDLFLSCIVVILGYKLLGFDHNK